MAVLTDEQTMLRDMAREWVSHESPVAAFRRVRDTALAPRYDSEQWRAQAEMGWAGIVVPEDHGGVGIGYLSLGLVLEQLGSTLSASPLAATSAAASAIVLGGSEAQKSEWLPRIASGEIVATIAFAEGPLFDPLRLDARVAGGRLTGTKAFVAEGTSAGLFVVSAQDGVYLVAAGDGVTRDERSAVDARSHALVRFVDAPAHRLGGPELAGQVADRAAAAIAAEMLGLAGAAFATTNDYLKTRIQFGQPLASFQALQHRMVHMLTELELTRSAVEDALDAIDAERDDIARAVSLSKALAGETAKLVTREMVQLHGGIGMTDEHDAGLYLKRSAVLETMWGNAAWHRERFARLSDY